MSKKGYFFLVSISCVFYVFLVFNYIRWFADTVASVSNFALAVGILPFVMVALPQVIILVAIRTEMSSKQKAGFVLSPIFLIAMLYVYMYIVLHSGPT